jgi:tetratricopeptide (TPR) repeat protein
VATLFGRRAELDRLQGLLSQALAGEGAAVLLAGEPGIGKSRLCREIAELAAAQGASVHWGRGWEGGGAPAFWPWTEALTSLVAGLNPSSLAALLGDDAPELVRLVPSLRARLPMLEAASLPEADEGRFRLAQAVAGVLRRAAEVQPRVVVLDDLHTADLATLSCLLLVARSLRGLRLLIVGTYREVEARLSPQLSEKLGALAREAMTLPLGALDRDAALALVRTEGKLEDAAAASIVDAAGGNPLFLSEMSRLVAAKSGARELPLGVKESIRQRLALLSEDARSALEAASAVGRTLDPPLTAALLDWELPRVSTALEGAREAGMVVERMFSHDLVREVLYRALPRERRLALHRSIADALQRRPEAEPSAVAHHRLEAAELDPKAAIRAAIDAARAALDLVAYEQALELLDRAEAVAKALDDRALHAELLCALGEARVRAGQPDAAKAACAGAVATARALGDAELLARAALTWGAEIQPGRVDPDLVAWLEEARGRLERNVPLKARVLGRLAAALQPAMQPQGPIALAKEAIALARETQDERLLLEVLHSAMAAMMDYEHPSQRLPLNLEQEALAQRFHDRPKELRARLRLFFDYFTLGDMGLAETRARSFDALAKNLKQARFNWVLPAWHATRAISEARFAEVPALLDEARELLPPGSFARLPDGFMRATMVRARENHAETLAMARREDSEWDGFQQAREMGTLLRAATFARLGHADESRALLNEVLRARVPPLPTLEDRVAFLVRIDPVIVMMLGETFAVLGKSVAKDAYEQLLQYEGLQAHMGLVGMAWEGPVDRTLGLLAAAAGELATAERHYDAALASLARTGSRVWLARTALEAAEVQLARKERARALEHVATARAVAAELDQNDLLTQFASRLPLDEAPAAKAAPSVPAAAQLSLERQGEYWEIRGGASTFRLKDSRGLQLLARLVERPDQELHCLELASDGPTKELDGGDAGEWLDADAKRAYQRRVEDLRETLEEAERHGDRGRVEKARAELDFIAAELSRGVGLGGRSRKAGSATERARVAVQRRIKDVLQRIAEHDEALGKHLEWAVKTGTYCSYRPSR